MQTISRHWDPALYDSKHDFVSKYGEDLLSILAPQPGEKILDVGCGTGDLTRMIAASGAAVSGFDLSPDMIAAAAGKYPEIAFHVASADNFRFPGLFDALFSNAALHWVLEYEAAAACMYHALRNGGRLVLEMGGKGNVAVIVSELCNVLREKGFAGNADIRCWYFPSLGEYASVLEKAGFRVQFASHFSRPTVLKEEGIVNWLRMFGSAFLSGIAEPQVAGILEEVQERLRPSCFRNGQWIAPYMRLRMVAVKD